MIRDLGVAALTFKLFTLVHIASREQPTQAEMLVSSGIEEAAKRLVKENSDALQR